MSEFVSCAPSGKPSSTPEPGPTSRQGILALDVATTTGWAFLPAADGEITSGTHSVAKPGTKLGAVLTNFADWLRGRLNEHTPRLVAFEAPILPAGRGANLHSSRRLYAMAGLVEMACHDHGIRCREFRVQQIKKHFTGNGRADKELMMATCRQRGWRPIDDNEADALALLDFAIYTIAPKVHAARLFL